MTGGQPSTAAVTAAQQAGDYYAAQMNDRIPELYQNAYSRYLNEFQQRLQNLSANRQAYQDSHSAYLDALNQYNADRSFNYNQALNDRAYATQLRNELEDQRRDARNFTEAQRLANLNYDEGVRQFDASNAYAQALQAYQLQRQAEQDALERERYDREYADARADLAYNRDYQASRDAVSDRRYDQEYADSRADLAYNRDYQTRRDEIADSRYADETAYNRSQDALDRNWQYASLLAGAGNFDRLRSMGFTDGEISALRQSYLADQAVSRTYGGSSGGSYRSSGGSGSSGSSDAYAPTEPDYQRLYQDASASASPANYIATHYKDYGFTKSTGLADSYSKWARSGGPGRTSFDYNEDEGVFTWNGNRYTSYAALNAALKEANLMDWERAALEGKLALYRLTLDD